MLHAFADNIAGDRITYLIAKQKPEEISNIIEELRMQQQERN
jgi:hypothetical protein